MLTNKVLLDHGHPRLFTYCPWLYARMMADLNNYDRDCMVCKAQNIYYLAHQRKSLL